MVSAVESTMTEKSYAGLNAYDIGPQLIVAVDAVKPVEIAGASTVFVIGNTEFETHVVVRQGSTIYIVIVCESV
jgi:hypothetical protein